MRIKKLCNNILLLVAKDQYELTSTFVRLQEYYESPYKNIRGKYFGLEEYMDTYAKHNGNFTYFSDWSGFNVPGNIVNNFYKMHANMRIPCRAKEKKLRDLILTKHDMKSSDYYIIGCTKNCSMGVIEHEVAHALFYLSPEYNEEMTKITKDYKKKNPGVAKALIKQGYDKDFIIDEMQAYNVEDRIEFKRIFEKYIKRCKIKL